MEILPYVVTSVSLDCLKYFEHSPKERIPGDNGGLAYRQRLEYSSSVPIFEILFKAAQRANRHFGFVITSLPYIQLARYEPGCQLGVHNDMFPMVDRFKNSQRKVSFTVQLSDSTDYDGGDLFLGVKPFEPEPDPYTFRRKDAAIFFPSFTSHAVTIVTRGTRYALVGWCVGPAFR